MSRQGKGWAVLGDFDNILAVEVGIAAEDRARQLAAELRSEGINAGAVPVTITEDNRNE